MLTEITVVSNKLSTNLFICGLLSVKSTAMMYLFCSSKLELLAVTIECLMRSIIVPL